MEKLIENIKEDLKKKAILYTTTHHTHLTITKCYFIVFGYTLEFDFSKIIYN